MGRKKFKPKLPAKNTASGTKCLKITGLNDKCLSKICNYLAIDDLASLAASCKRFIAVCGETFEEKYKLVHCNFPIRIWELRNVKKVECYKNMITFFGNKMRKMRVEYDSKDYYDNKIIHDLIVEHCSATIIEIHFIDMKKGMKINKPFQRLTHLTYSHCHLSDSSTQFDKWFPNLLELQLELVQSIANPVCIERTIPKLEQFGLVNFMDCNINNKNMIRFIKNNPQLKGLRICRDSLGLALDITYKYISYIDLMLPNLESLDMTYMSRLPPLPVLNELPKFSQLKNLRMVCRDASTLPAMMNSVKSIEQLTLDIEHGANDDTIDYILNCPTLSSLTWHLNTSDEPNLVFKLSKKPLPALTELKLYSSFGTKDNCFKRAQPLVSVFDFLVNHKQLNKIIVGFVQTDCEASDLMLSDVLQAFSKVVKNKFNGEWTTTYHLQRVLSKCMPLVEEVFICVNMKKNLDAIKY